MRFAAGAASFRSEDGGASWQPVPILNPFSAFYDDGNRILGTYPLGSLAYTSTDDGKTWQPLQLLTFNIGPLQCCVIDPADPQHFLLGSLSNSQPGTGIVETRDGGVTFQLIDQQPHIPLAFDPGKPGVIYGYTNWYDLASIGYYRIPGTFLKSDDGGRTWRLPSSGAGIPTRQVIVDPSGSGRIYIFGPFGVYRSDGRGETWTRLSGQLGNAPFSGGSVSFAEADRVYGVAYMSGDGYVAKLDAAGNLVFSTLLGGRNSDQVQSVAIASNGDVLVGGTTQSDDLLVAGGTSVRTNGAYEQGFLARLSSDGSALLGFRYVGGSMTDSISSIALLSSGELAVAGGSASPDQPDVTSDAFAQQFTSPCCGGFLGVYSSDAFVPRFFSFLGDTAWNVAAVGMRAYLSGFNFSSSSNFMGIPLVCENNDAQNCNALFVAVDLTPGAASQ